MQKLPLSGCLCVAAALSACSRSNNLLLGEVQAQVGTHTVRVTDCYRTSVPPPERLPDAGGQASYRFMPCRDADVQIRAGELTVNGRSYGHIQKGDTILVDHGVVSVNPPKLQAHAGK
ncbi:MAG: hypothetical protein ABSG03_30960 [Bryobacteraceae bacterium]|jgi:hypothetical protein